MRIALILFILNGFLNTGTFAQESLHFHKDSVVDDSVVLFISCDAEFPGGYDSLKRYYQEFGEYIPENWADSNFNKRGYVMFFVEIDGTLSNIEVQRSINQEADLLLTQFAENMPNWIPACDQFGPVRSRVRLPLTFSLPE